MYFHYFTKGNKFCDFLFAFLEVEALLNGIESKERIFCSKSGAPLQRGEEVVADMKLEALSPQKVCQEW